MSVNSSINSNNSNIKPVTLSEVNKVVLVSIDGWGYSPNTVGNAIAAATTPNMNLLTTTGLSCLIDASGLSVGLPDQLMGNSEVGHLTMGTGRVEYQDLVRINLSIENNKFNNNPVLVRAFDQCKSTTNRLHLLGLVSDGGVHSHIKHLFQFISAAKSAGIAECYIHVFADGRDTPPTSGIQYIQQLQAYLTELQYGSIATVIGRYYAMDRDKRWDRIKLAMEALVAGIGAESTTNNELIQFLTNKYSSGSTDEFLKPIIVNNNGLIKDQDTLIFFDFRSDRMREIVSQFVNSSLGAPIEFDSTIQFPTKLNIIQMTQYNENILLPTLFPPQENKNSLSEWLSLHSLRQFHTAETEKYAHVTFFFSGGRELPFIGEDRLVIPSPKVTTYDLAPEMSQLAVADSVIAAMIKQEYSFILCNLAAPDMVGHTGEFNAAIIACNSCDKAIGKLIQACADNNYILVVTADHGNAEEMQQLDGTPKTSHTNNPIPLLIKSPNIEQQKLIKWNNTVELIQQTKGEYSIVGGLSDVAPTILSIMGLTIPTEMTGKNLIHFTNRESNTATATVSEQSEKRAKISID